MKLVNALNKKLHTPLWLFVLLVVVFVFRIPTFFEPYSYGDEMIYLALGEAVRQGIPLYKGIHDNKPPLLYLTAAIAGNLFWFRAILAIWHLVTIYILWKFSEKLFPKNTKLQKVATILFAILTTLPFLEGNIANSELFMIGPTLLAFYILLFKKNSFKNIFGAGLLFSIASLYKIPAAFDIPAIVFYWIVTTKVNIKNILTVSKKTFFLGIGFLAPILLTFAWYYLQGAFAEYFIAAFGQNVGYLSSFRPDDVQEPFFVKNGPLLIRAGVVAAGMLLLYLLRNKISKKFIFLSAWLLLTIFAVTLSERPYPHYLVQSVPPLTLLVGILFTVQKMEQVLSIIPLSLLFVAPVYFGFWYYPSAPYYVRFYEFATGQLSRESYMSSFGGNVVVNYKIAEFITKEDPGSKDPIYVWGDNGTIYSLTRRLPPLRYVADYHISDFSSAQETVAQLQKNMPSYIILLPNAPEFRELNLFIQNNYGLAKTIDGAEIWRLLSPELRY